MSSLSRNEQRIVAALQADARQTNRALAASVGMAASTTLDRVRDLERRGVLTGYHAAVDPVALGRSMAAMVSVRLSPKTEQVIDEFMSQLWGLPETVSTYMISGVDDIMVHLSVRDTEDLRRIVLNNIASHPSVVDETTMLVFEHRQKKTLPALD